MGKGFEQLQVWQKAKDIAVLIYKVTADFLKSYGKDPEEYLGPEPSGDNVDDPETENTLMIQGDFERVTAQIAENHFLHIQKHMELENSPSLKAVALTAPHMVEQIVNFNRQHIQQHMQMVQIMQALMTKVGGGGGGTGSKELTDTGSQGDGKPSRMETAPGPLGNALETKRSGEIQGASGGNGASGY